jgi:hypothetical protein
MRRAITSTRSAFGTLTLLLALVAGSAVAAAPPPSLRSTELAQGPYSSMHMLLEKTFLKVDVLTVDVRFGKAVHPRLAELVKGQSYSDELAKQVADLAIRADDALIQLKFVRDVSLEQWMDGVKENLEQAREAGLITKKLQQRVSQGLPGWFAALKERGYKTGDRVLYRVRPDGLRTVVVTVDGKVLVDRLDADKEAPRVVMASYFAPRSDFRDLLVRSLFKSPG